MATPVLCSYIITERSQVGTNLRYVCSFVRPFQRFYVDVGTPHSALLQVNRSIHHPDLGSQLTEVFKHAQTQPTSALVVSNVQHHTALHLQLGTLTLYHY